MIDRRLAQVLTAMYFMLLSTNLTSFSRAGLIYDPSPSGIKLREPFKHAKCTCNVEMILKWQSFYVEYMGWIVINATNLAMNWWESRNYDLGQIACLLMKSLRHYIIKLMYFNLITFYTSSQRFICSSLNLRENL